MSTPEMKKIQDGINTLQDKLDDAIEAEREDERNIWADLLDKAATAERTRQDANDAVALALERIAEALNQDVPERIDRI